MDVIEIESDDSDLSSISIHEDEKPKKVINQKSKNGHPKEEAKEINNGASSNEKHKTKSFASKTQISLDEDYDSSNSTLDQSFSDKYVELNESLQQKNKYIEELLNDLKSMDVENKSIRGELVHLRNKLSEATGQIQQQAIIIQNHNSENSQLLEQIGYLKKTEGVLQTQLDNYADTNKKFEVQMDSFVEQMNSRIKEWKDILEMKDDEILELKVQMLQYQEKTLLVDQKDPGYYDEIMKQREHQIHDLQQKLSEATKDLRTSSQTIEVLKKEQSTLKAGISCESLEDSHTIEKLKSELAKWKNQTEDIERCLQLKEMELVEFLKDAHTFEDNEFGFKNIFQVNKKHKQQLKIRDDQIKKLVSENNKFNISIDQLQTENIILRKRLNLPSDQPISSNNILSKYAKLKKDMASLIKKQSLIDEQNISLKIRLRQKEKSIKKLYEHLKHQGVKLPEHFISVILDENSEQQAFEPDNHNVQNIHEIVDSEDESSSSEEIIQKKQKNNIKTKKAPSVHEVETNDSLKPAESEVIKENQRALQTILQESRMETLNTLNLLTKETQKNLVLEQKLMELQKEIHSKHQPTKSDDQIPTAINDESEQKTTTFACVQQSNKSYGDILNKNLRHFHEQFEFLYNNIIDIYNQNIYEKDSWLATEIQYKKENNELNLQLKSLRDLLDEFKSNRNVELLFKDVRNEDMNKIGDIDEINIDSFANNNYQHSFEILLHKMYLQRKSAYLEDTLKFVKNDNKNLQAEVHHGKIKIYEQARHYEIELQKAMLQNADLRNALTKSIPLDLYVKQNVKLNRCQIKYRELLDERSFDRSDADMAQLEVHSNNDVAKNLTFKVKQLEKENLALQENQNELINKYHSLWTETEANEEEEKEHSKKMCEQLKVENTNLLCKLQTLEEQVNYFEQRKLVEDLEINLLSHQILDLQSTNDNKAAIARLGGEILVSHIHMADIHNKQEKLIVELQKEKEKNRILNSLVHEKNIQFNSYILKTNSKISFLSSTLQVIREQYQGAIPLAVLENVRDLQVETRNKFIELQNSNFEIDKIKEELYNSIYNDILEKMSSNMQCGKQDGNCHHLIDLEIKSLKWEREKSTLKTKYQNIKKSHKKLRLKIEELEETIVMLNFSSKDASNKDNILCHKRATSVVELTDVNEDEFKDNEAEKVLHPVPKPRTISKTSHNLKEENLLTSTQANDLPGSPTKSEKKPSKKVTVNIQTDRLMFQTVECQANLISNDLSKETFAENADSAMTSQEKESYENELRNNLALISEKSVTILNMQSEIAVLKAKTENLEESLKNKNKLIAKLESKCEEIKYSKSVSESDTSEVERLKSILTSLKTMESEKNETIEEYKQLLKHEKQEHNETNVLAQKQINDMKIKMKSLEDEHNNLKTLMTQPSHVEAYNVSMENYRTKILDLESRCFQLQTDYDHEHAALISAKSECERWKTLAAERFANLEKLNKHLEATHKDEVGSYKAETSHWLTQLTSATDELSQTKIKFNEFKNNASKLISERNLIIEGLHSVNCNLKQKLLNLQSVVSSTDPSFDLGAIIEVDESNSDGESPSLDKASSQSDAALPNKPMSIAKNSRFDSNWSQPIVNRLRKEKQILYRQNSILRKQLKILTSRERRAKLELQNTKAQMLKSYKFTQKIVPNNSEEVDELHKKIEMLEYQLIVKFSKGNQKEFSKESQLALWEKQKRWQETSERWKQKCIEKCSELNKLQKQNDGLRSTLQRLEREKRNLDSRLSKRSREGVTPSTIASEGDLELLLQDKERLEAEVRSLKTKLESTISHGSLLERIEAQQRRITAFELAERGKDVLVDEYEKILAQNSFLSKQNIKLESEMLEYQLLDAGKRHDPDGSDGEHNCCRRLKRQNQHYESYVKLLKEENNQLIAKNIELSSITPLTPTAATTTQAREKSNMEKTVLTLRGLISKLQAENKGLSRANGKLKEHIQNNALINNLISENERLKETISEKDNLLKDAKELLKRAVEKEKQAAENKD